MASITAVLIVVPTTPSVVEKSGATASTTTSSARVATAIAKSISTRWLRLSSSTSRATVWKPVSSAVTL